MITLKKKDLLYRKKFRKLEQKILLNKFVFVNLLNDKKFSVFSNFLFLNFIHKKFKFIKSKNKIVRRCIFTNRGRSVTRFCGISRVLLRSFIQSGLIPGYMKAV